MAGRMAGTSQRGLCSFSGKSGGMSVGGAAGRFMSHHACGKLEGTAWIRQGWLCEEADGPYMYLDTLEADKNTIDRLAAAAESLQELC